MGGLLNYSCNRFKAFLKSCAHSGDFLGLSTFGLNKCILGILVVNFDFFGKSAAIIPSIRCAFWGF